MVGDILERDGAKFLCQTIWGVEVCPYVFMCNIWGIELSVKVLLCIIWGVWLLKCVLRVFMCIVCWGNEISPYVLNDILFGKSNVSSNPQSKWDGKLYSPQILSLSILLNNISNNLNIFYNKWITTTHSNVSAIELPIIYWRAAF